MSELADLLHRAASLAAGYRDGLAERPLTAEPEAAGFGGPLQTESLPADQVLDDLVRAAEPALLASAGPRFFGFVIGGALEAATAADVLATGWDQCAFNPLLSPAAAAAERSAGGWLKELLQLPATASVGFVTGAQEANTVGLAAGRHHVLAEVGYDVERDGLHGAPPVRVVAGQERHATIDRSLRLLGLGTRSVQPVPADANGAVDVTELARVLEERPGVPTVVCLQAGNVNTGACDPLAEAVPLARAHGAWVHVDGAFGLWAAASPRTRHLLAGVGLADSWGCDAHKWLNVPYDSGLAFCARPEVHASAIRYTASYLPAAGAGHAMGDFTLGSSRRARGFAVWAALRQLGSGGVAELVERCCALARRFAEALEAAGAEVANEVVLNQVLVSFGSDEETDEVIAHVQRDGVCWMGGTTWRGRRYMRISVSNYLTTEEDVDRSVAAVLRAAGRG